LAFNLHPYVTGKPHPLQGFIVSTSLLRQGDLPRLRIRRLDARMVDRRTLV